MRPQSYSMVSGGEQSYYLQTSIGAAASQATPTSQWSSGGAAGHTSERSYYSAAPTEATNQVSYQQQPSSYSALQGPGSVYQAPIPAEASSFIQQPPYSNAPLGQQQTVWQPAFSAQGNTAAYSPNTEALPQSMPAAPPPALNATDENGLRWTWSTYPSAQVLLAAEQSEASNSSSSAGGRGNNSAGSGGGSNPMPPASHLRADSASVTGAIASTVAPLSGIKQSATDLLSKVSVKSHKRKNPYFPCPMEMVIPFSCMYEPLHPLADPTGATVYQIPEGLQCNRCGAFCSIHSLYDEMSWVCLGCQNKLVLPRPLPPDHPMRRFCTVEYVISSAPHLPPTNAAIRHHGSPPSTHDAGAANPALGAWYSSVPGAPGPPSSVRDHGAVIFIVDISIPTEEREALKQHLLEALQWLLPTTLVGLITTGSTTAVWELSNQYFRRCFVLRGATTLNYHGYSRALQVKSTESTRGKFLVPLQECRPRLEQLIYDLRGDPEVVLSSNRPTRLTGTAIAAATFLIEALSPLQALPNEASGGKNSVKPPKAVNSLNSDLTTPLTAPLPSAAVAETRIPGRILLFTGGPCTRGGGAVASPEKEQLMRFHRDLLEENTSFFDNATKFYEDLSKRLLYVNSCVDVFAQSFDQVGVMEMRTCVDCTGGYMICGDAFEHENFLHSLRRYALRVGLCPPETMISVLSSMEQQQGNSAESAEEDLAELEEWVWANAGTSGVGVEVEVICRADDLVVSGVLGPCVPAAPSGPRSSGSRPASTKGSSTSGKADSGKNSESQRWFASTMHTDTALAILFDVSPSASAASSPAYTRYSGGPQERFVQFITRYSTMRGERRIRVTSVRLPISPYGVSPQYFMEAGTFDETCAATIMARLAARAMEKSFSQWRQIRHALDNVLIDFVSRFATFTPGQPDSVQLPQGVSLFPVFLFNLRRSEYFMIINISPDEATFKRHWLMREPVDRCVLMIQPTLYSYDLTNPSAVAVPLDSQSLQADNIVLMDAFFNMHIMWGSTIYEWIKQKYHEDPEYEHFKNLLSAVEDDARILLNQRFPYPRFSRTDANGSEARHIKNRVNPAHTYSGTGSASDPYGAGSMIVGMGAKESADVINTDDTSIAKFTASLKRIVTGGESQANSGAARK